MTKDEALAHALQWRIRRSISEFFPDGVIDLSVTVTAIVHALTHSLAVARDTNGVDPDPIIVEIARLINQGLAARPAPSAEPEGTRH